MRRREHNWNRVFWLGFPLVLGLLWIHQDLQHVVSALVLCGVTMAWILHGVRSLFMSVPAGGLLTTYARVQVSMGFTALVIVGLFVVWTLGSVWYVVVLALWLGFYLLARAFVAWLIPEQSQALRRRSGSCQDEQGDRAQSPSCPP